MTQAGGSGTSTPGSRNGQDGTHLNTLMIDNTEFPVIQENGQRKCGPPPDWEGPPPFKGSEVFVGKIPRDLLEDTLIPIFKTVGKIYELRLMMDFEGNNRGYAFVTYSNPEEAKQAIKDLDNYEIRKNRFIGVCKSVDNCRLFVGGIPKTKTKEEILLEMKKYTDAVSDVILYSSIADKSKNRGFAFVEYENHKAAAVARRKLMPGKIQLFGNDVAVDWAEPELEVDEDTMAKVTVLYVRNLMPHTTEETIKDTFSAGDKFKIDKVKKLRDFAFIHYRNRDDAETALEEFSGSVLEGAQIEVTWAKPVDKAFRPRSRCLPAHSAVSVFNPYLIGLEPFSGHIPFPPPLQMRPPAMPRMPFVRRGRGAAGIRRFRNYPSANRPMVFKPLEMPVSSVPSPYTSYPPNKLSRIPEEGKAYHTHDYNMYIPTQSSSDDSSVQTLSGPALAPYPGHARIAHHGYLPIPGYDDNTYYTFVTTAHPPPGTIPMY